jgi:hypothetical protein
MISASFGSQCVLLFVAVTTPSTSINYLGAI